MAKGKAALGTPGEAAGVGIFAQRNPGRGSQPKTAVKARVRICLVTMGEMGECRLGWGLGYPLSQDQKKPLDWKGIAFALHNRI